MIFRKALAASALAALIGGGMLAATTGEASARTVCNQWGNCWHEPGYYGDRGAYYHSDYDSWRYRYRHRYHDYDRDRDYWRYHHHDRDYDRDRY